MEITRANLGAGMGGGAPVAEAGETQDRERLVRNSMAELQARYGEKPKEARAIKKQLDKDDFMRIMITEMRHQDPTKPMDAERMATQMAQITSVEQLKNVSNAIEKLSDKNSASDRLAMSGMIGKTVTVDKGRFSHQKGTISPINFELPEDASKIKITILNEKGDEVATRDLEPMKAGNNIYNWDGVTSSSTPGVSGTYLVRVDAENAKGAKLKIDPVSKETVIGVSFEGGETNFLVGDSKSPQRVNFKNVTRIESDSGPRPQSAKKTEADALPEGLKEKMKTELARASTTGQPEPAAEAEGFPNGLND
ncbi:MAG: flagellar hook assembly protein FlgD [Proteobacteria bacterium]|nr:flagellar hook assembly protein FlgD [Pseudomonadota bacterium]